jgi:hypothetical protein
MFSLTTVDIQLITLVWQRLFWEADIRSASLSLYSTARVNTVFTRGRYLSMSWDSSISSYLIQFNIILPLIPTSPKWALAVKYKVYLYFSCPPCQLHAPPPQSHPPWVYCRMNERKETPNYVTSSILPLVPLLIDSPEHNISWKAGRYIDNKRKLFIWLKPHHPCLQVSIGL